MSSISRLKDRRYYIDFAAACIRDENGEVVARTKSPINRKVLRYFADHPGVWLAKDDIIPVCWPDHPDANSVEDGTFWRKIHDVRKIHTKVEESIDSSRMGYMYLGALTEERPEEPPEPPQPPVLVPRPAPRKAAGLSEAEVVADLTTMLIRKSAEGRATELAADPFAQREQGIGSDFQEVCDQARRYLKQMEKALQILLSTYENLTRDVPADDTNTRSQ